MRPISAKSVAKKRHQNAPHVTFICAQIACMSILVISMSLSSHIYFNVSLGSLIWHMYPPPPCISYVFVQATVGVRTVIILYAI